MQELEQDPIGHGIDPSRAGFLLFLLASVDHRIGQCVPSLRAELFPPLLRRQYREKLSHWFQLLILFLKALPV